MYTFLVVVQVVTAIALIGLVLIQHGKGADAGAAFGSGASGTVFGARGSANFLTRATAICATVFFVASLSLAYVVQVRKAPSGSVVEESAPAEPAVPGAEPAVPGAEPAVPETEPAAPAPEEKAPEVPE